MGATISSTNLISNSLATRADEIRIAFTEHKQELTWLAEFLVGDETVASACMIDAYSIARTADDVADEWREYLPREATICSTLQIERARIAQLASAYERCACVHREHAALSREMVQFLLLECDAIQNRLDVLCRFVLVLCGVEQRSFADAALLLGITQHAVQNAYCAALKLVELVWCEVLLESHGAAISN